MPYLIGLLFLATMVLVVFSWLKVRYVFSWFWAIFVCTVVWGGMLALGGRVPAEVPLFVWEEIGVESPELLLDAISWPFALAVCAIALGVVLTSAQRLADTETTQKEGGDSEPLPGQDDWRNLAAILAMTAFGLLGVLAGNPLTLLLAWAGGDLLGLWVLLRRIIGREESERLVLDFSARVAGILLLIWAMVTARTEGDLLQFDRIPAGVNVYLLLVCGFRLGVLPLQIYFLRELPLRRGLGTMARMTMPVAASLVLLVRIASTMVPSRLDLPLLGLTAFAGLYGSFYWLAAKNEVEGRSFWVLGMGSLAVASAILGEPMAVAAWGLALLLAGGGLFLFSARSRGMRVLMGINLWMITALPGTPSAMGMGLFTGEFEWFWVPFLLIHGLLLAGYARHVWQDGERGQVSVRAVRAAYTFGLLILPGTLFLVGGNSLGMLSDAWWASSVGVGLAALMGVWAWRGGRLPMVARRVFSFHWFYRLLWRGYRLLGGGVTFFSMLLEGEAGVLWTLLILSLLLSLITTQVGLGG